MNMYYFVCWEQTENGYRPMLPDGIGFSMLAEPGRTSDGAGFALFECYLPDDLKITSAIKPVSSELAELLDSAKDYPPALALAREEIAGNNTNSEAEFSKTLAERLHCHLQKQPNSPHFLAKAIISESFYKEAGGYYWIVGCHAGLVQWVSRDYHIYRDPITEFEVDATEVEARFNRRK